MPEKKRVLIVEDDEATREAFALVLRQAGYTTRTAANGHAALELLAHEPPPGLIVLDLSMPGMDGQQFRARQLGDPRLAHIPVIVCSASGRLRDRDGHLRAADYLDKPIDPPTLLAAVSRHYAPPGGPLPSRDNKALSS